MYTLPETDLELPGPLPFTFERRYSSFIANRDFGLGWGWAHTLVWEVHERFQGWRTRVFTDTGTWEDFPVLKAGEAAQAKWGWILRRESYGTFSIQTTGCSTR